MDRREFHVAAGPSGRLGLKDRTLTISPKQVFLIFPAKTVSGFITSAPKNLRRGLEESKKSCFAESTNSFFAAKDSCL
jgi:hypothetical protein